jgi:TP901 family phage tail tape measure protein
MTENINTQITASADFSSLIGQIHQAVSQLTLLQQKIGASNVALSQQIAASNNAFANTLKNSNQFSTHFVTLASDTEKFGKALDSGKLKLRDYYNSWQQYHRQGASLIKDLAKQQVAMQNAIIQPMGRNGQGQMQFNVHVPTGIDELANKTRIAKQEMSILNKVMSDGATQLINWGKNTQWAGRQLTVGLTVPMAAFGQAAAQSFLQVDAELVRLTKVYGGLAQTSQAELGKVRSDTIKTAKELSGAYGVNFKETIALAADIAATGKQGNELMGSLKETTRLSVLGEVSRQDAMKATLAIQNAFKQNTTELGQSIDFLNAVENQTSTTLQDLVNAIPKAGPVVKGLGGDVKDLALMMVAMKEGGVDAASAANGLKSALGSLINPTKNAKTLFRGFGIDLQSIVNNNAGNVTETILALQNALDKLNPLQKQQALETLFGKYQFARMGALFDNLGKKGSQTLQVLDLMKASTQELANVASRELAQQTESASGKYKRALESLKADLATVGSGFLGVSANLLQIADGILKAFNALPGPVKKFVTLLAGLTAVAGPIIMLTGVFSNFLGYVMKGFAGIRAFFSHADKFKLLTPEIVAADEAAMIMEKTFYSDAEAAMVLKNALTALKLEMRQIAEMASSNTITAKPLVQDISNATHGGTVPINGLDFAHYNPQARLSEEDRLKQTFHTSIPLDPTTNKKIGENPQMMVMPGTGIPKVPGLTMINGATTGVNAVEAAKWNTMMTTMAMRTKTQMAEVERVLDTTGQLPAEFMADFNLILPKMQNIAATAAQSSARVARSAEAGILTVEESQRALQAINAKMIERMNALSIASGVPIERMTMVPGTNTQVATGTAAMKNQDYNMRSVTRTGTGRVGGLTSKISNALKVGVRRIKLQNGATSIGYYSKGFTPKGALAAARMLKAFAQRSSGIGGLRTPNLRGTGSGPSTISASEAGTGVSFGLLTKRNSKIYRDPSIQEYGITPTSGDDFLVHALTPGYRARTSSLPTMGNQSTPSVPADRFSEFGIKTSSKSPYLQTLPTQFVKNTKKFNEALRAGADPSQFRTVDESDMVSLLLFLKDQGVPAAKAKIIAGRAANVLNELVSNSKVPITEALFGNMVNRASVRAIRSGFLPSMTRVTDSLGYDIHTRNRGLAPARYAGGVTRLPGYGGGDIIPAMLEPGESVVTKQATARYAPIIDAMNKGQLPGFKLGVTGIAKAGASMGISYAGSALGDKIGGPVGTVVSTASQLFGFGMGFSMFSKEGAKAGRVASMFSGITSKFPGLFAKTVFGLSRFNLALAVGIPLLAGAYNKYKQYQEQQRLTALGYGLTADAAKKAGLRYTDFNGKMKDAIANAQLMKEKNHLIYESMTQSNTPLKITIEEYKKLKETVSKTMPDYIKLVNITNSKDVGSLAVQLKAQFISAGKSAEDATKMVYALIAASNKSAMAGKAIGSQDFAGVTDAQTASVQTVKTFAASTKLSNGKAQTQAFMTALQGIDAAILDIEANAKKMGKPVDAAAVQFEAINKGAGKSVTLTKSMIDNLKNENPELAKILNTSDNIQSAWAKYKLLIGGSTADLVTLTGKAAIALQTMDTAIEKSVVAGLGASGGMLNTTNKKLKELYATKARLEKQAAGQSAKAQIDAKTQLKSLNDQIDKINKKAEAEKKALEDKAAAEDIVLQIQQKRLEYQNAIATGNMQAAAQAQLEVDRLQKQQQLAAGVNAIEEKRQKDVAPLQAQIDALNAAQDKLANSATLASDALNKTNKEIADLETKASLVTAAFTRLEKGLNEQGDAYKKTQTYKDDIAALAKAIADGKFATPGVSDTKTVYNGSYPSTVKKTPAEIAEEYLNSARTGLEKGISANTVYLNAKAVLDADAKAAGKQLTNAQLFKQQSYTTSTEGAAGMFDSGGTIKAQVRDSLLAQNGGKNFKIGDRFTVNGHTYGVKKGSLFNSTYGMQIVEIDMANKADGGIIRGPGSGTSDSIPTMLSNGEYVIKASSVKSIGVPALDNLNRMASGGLVARYDMPRMTTGGRLKMGTGGIAQSGGSEYNINVTLNGSNLTPDDVANAIERKMRQLNAMNGTQRTFN